MMNTVLTKAFSPPPVNYKEILRYMQAGNSPFSEKLIRELISECEKELVYKVCYSEFSLKEIGGVFDFSFSKIKSNTLEKNLKGCTSVIIFAATIGLFIDRVILTYSKLSPSKALFFQAFGTERAEALANAFNAEISDEFLKKGLYTRPRISPGYGDLPLSFQEDIFKVLDPSRKIGLTLNESLIMSPSKSVTALIGLSPSPCFITTSGCDACEKRNCLYRDDLK